MMYAKSRVAPPKELKQIQQYYDDIVKLSSEIKSLDSQKSEDSVLNVAVCRIAVFEKENKLTNDSAVKSRAMVAGVYAPKFLKRCFFSFAQAVWHDSDHAEMTKNCNILKGLRNMNGTSVLGQSTLDSLNLVAKIISEYKDARSISHYSSFTGYETARSVVARANAYAKNPYLSNCTSLMSDLQGAKDRIASSCYSYVSRKVESLNNYRPYSRSSFESLAKSILSAINEYDNKAYAIFGNKQNVGTLRNRYKSYYNSGISYYNRIQREYNDRYDNDNGYY